MRPKRSSSDIIIHLVLCLIFGISIGGCASSVQQVQPGQVQDLLGERQILFIGNSYTFYNDLPAMLEKLARAGGHRVRTAMVAEGGWTLDDHDQSPQTTETLEQHEWEYVVLQEQSVIPSDPARREAKMYPAVRALNTDIMGASASTILFLTWGRRDGLPESGFADFNAMQTALTMGYAGIADELDVRVSPVGEAWAKAIEQDSQIELWQADGSHPSEAGSYLAACVFYAVIFQESPEGLSYMAGLDAEIGNLLQSVAAQTVLPHLERWHID